MTLANIAEAVRLTLAGEEGSALRWATESIVAGAAATGTAG